MQFREIEVDHHFRKHRKLYRKIDHRHAVQIVNVLGQDVDIEKRFFSPFMEVESQKLPQSEEVGLFIDQILQVCLCLGVAVTVFGNAIVGLVMCAVSLLFMTVE